MMRLRTSSSGFAHLALRIIDDADRRVTIGRDVHEAADRLRALARPSGSKSLSGCARPRWMRIAALSVMTEPSGSTSVGICTSGFTRVEFVEARTRPPTTLDLRTMRPKRNLHGGREPPPRGVAAALRALWLPSARYVWDHSRSGGHHLTCWPCLPAIHLFRRHVLDVRGDGPHMAEGIGERAGAIAVELVRHRAHLCGACRDRLARRCCRRRFT